MRYRDASTAERRRARTRRNRAAASYKPPRPDLLLVAEAPPNDLERYFYFEDVTEHDALFRHVTRGVLGREPTRENKREILFALRERAVFLIDLKLDPVDGTPLRNYVDDLVERCRLLNPVRIILIKTSVYDVAFQALATAGLPVVAERIPFPGSGRQREFELAFRRALQARP
jgi:hypothetical protein